MRYVALVDGKKGAYGVVVPDLPGCTSAGKTVDAAYHNRSRPFNCGSRLVESSRARARRWSWLRIARYAARSGAAWP